MKMLPEKTVMAVIILSCGLVVHAEPSAQSLKTRQATTEGARNWHTLYAEADVHAVRSAKILRQTALPSDLVRLGKSN